MVGLGRRKQTVPVFGYPKDLCCNDEFWVLHRGVEMDG